MVSDIKWDLEANRPLLGGRTKEGLFVAEYNCGKLKDPCERQRKWEERSVMRALKHHMLLSCSQCCLLFCYCFWMCASLWKRQAKVTLEVHRPFAPLSRSGSGHWKTSSTPCKTLKTKCHTKCQQSPPARCLRSHLYLKVCYLSPPGFCEAERRARGLCVGQHR